MGFRLVAKSVTLNLKRRSFCVILPNSVAFGAYYVKVVDQPLTDSLPSTPTKHDRRAVLFAVAELLVEGMS